MYDIPEPLIEDIKPCSCVDCVGDFSGATEDEVWGGR